jgi:general secretion pathway protein K
MESRRTAERGAALLVVMVAVAVLTVLAVQLAYDTRVSLQIAANARDELRATYLAKSGVSLSRLVLSFQKEIDDLMPQQTSTVAMPRPQLWRLVPVGSALVGNLFGGGAPEAAHGADHAVPPADGEAHAAGDAVFEAKMEDESRKVNVQLDGTAGLLGAQVQSLYQLICDSRWDVLFDREDENGFRASRQDLIVYLRDWIDQDEQGSAIAASFPPGDCTMFTAPNPFEQGFGDENQPYDRGEDRYRAKNARMDSLDELYLVAGVGDAFMAAFGDSLTVYLEPNAKRNVNETDKDRLVELAMRIADPPAQPALFDPKFGPMLQEAVLTRTFGGMFAMSPADFGDIVGTLGVVVNRNLLLPTNQNSPFTDRSTVFGIRSQASAGAVSKTLDVVVRLEKTQPPAPTPGRLIHWREE